MLAHAQQDDHANEYNVPSSFSFDYKVVYQVNDEDKNTTRTMTYYFTKSGDYMGMVPPKETERDVEFMINTKDGNMLSFMDEPSSKNQNGSQKTLTILNMRSMLKGLSNVAKTMPQNEKKKEHAGKDNLSDFKKTGRTKQVFGYTAEEYVKPVSGEDRNGKMHSGTVSVWYAKVDFDPEMMFSLGMGKLSGSRTHGTLQNNVFELGLTQKNYLLVEAYFIETGGKSETGMKVIDLGKTAFNQSTTGYQVKNFNGFGMR
jgi:hypothetical protein